MVRTKRIATWSLLLSVLASVVLVGAGIFLKVSPTTSAAYSVQHLDREIRLHPRAWVGRTVSVRAVGLRYFWGSGYGIVAGQQALLIAPPFSAVFSSTAYGSRRAPQWDRGRRLAPHRRLLAATFRWKAPPHHACSGPRHRASLRDRS